MYFDGPTPKIHENPLSACIPSGMNDCIEPDADVTSLTSRLAVLTTEHRDLDAVITQISQAPPPNSELLLRRLKKRKLLLKDRIAMIQRMLDPDVPA